MKTLAPQHLTDSITDPIEKQLKRIFWKIIFEPLTEAIAGYTDHPTHDEDSLENAGENILRDALRTGRIQYHDGVYTGDLSALVSRALRAIGARFDKRSGVYRQDVSEVPVWIRAESSGFAERARAAHDALIKVLDQTQADLDAAVDRHTVDPNETLDRIEGGFDRIARNISVMPTLSGHAREELAAEYTDNMKLYIKNWANESIQKLRQDVQENATKGYRFATLAEGIKHQYGVSASKAKFLARQETSLFMSNFRKEKFTEAGIQKYKWSSSHDVRVRHDHRELDGRVFSYNDPPVVDKATAKRGNPGTDFNCRCVDIPLVGTHLMETSK